MLLEFKTKTGEIATIKCEELLKVDGEKYQPTFGYEEVREILIDHESRIKTLTEMIKASIRGDSNGG